MRITDEQAGSYRADGFLFLESCFSPGEVTAMQAELPVLYAQDSPGRVLEQGSGVVRSVYGSHTSSEVFGRLTRDPRLVEPAMRILGSPVYVHQFKINAKQSFAGEVWEWHQDYIFWKNQDGMPEARVINAVLFLDEVNEFNGPLLLIPGSQRRGVIEPASRTPSSMGMGAAPSWASDVSAQLTFSLGREEIRPLVEEHGIVAPKGPAGSVLFFDPNLVHGSAPNMSPFDRSMALITYNSVQNIPVPVANPRPEFLCSRDYTPVVPLREGVLV